MSAALEIGALNSRRVVGANEAEIAAKRLLFERSVPKSFDFCSIACIKFAPVRLAPVRLARMKKLSLAWTRGSVAPVRSHSLRIGAVEASAFEVRPPQVRPAKEGAREVRALEARLLRTSSP